MQVRLLRWCMMYWLCWQFMHCFSISVGNTFIACMLTIVGYSINATIVIFDRIRENLGRTAAKQTPELI